MEPPVGVPSRRPLGAGTALAVADALAFTVGRCLGPACGTLLFARDTGDVLLTADGSRALAALRLDHPVARMVVDCASAHCTVTGDGAKSFVVLLAALLRGASGLGPEAAASSRRRAFADQLPALRRDVLDGVASGPMRRHMTVADAASERRLHDAAEAVVRTALSCNLGAAAAEALAPATLGLVFPRGPDGGDDDDDDPAACLAERASFAVEHFARLCTEEVGAPVGRSRCVEGLLLSRDFSAGRPPADGAVRFVAATRRLRPLASEGLDVTWRYASDSQLQRSQVWADRQVEASVEGLARDGVAVLFSAVKQSDCLLHHARRAGLAVVECVPDDELALLCELAGAAPVAGGGDAGLLAGTAAFCRRLPLEGGGARALVATRRPARSLVACAPTAGVASQYAAAAGGALKLLRLWARPVPRRAGASDGPDAVPAGASLPAGGAFELLLGRHLTEEAAGGDRAARPARAVLAEALLEIPRRLQRNLRPGRRFPELLSAAGDGLRRSGRLDARLLSAGGACGAEPVAAKLLLVGAVMDCLRRVTRVDAVVRVAGPLPGGAGGHRGDGGDSEDDE